MNNVGTLPWLNETALAGIYPLSKPSNLRNYLVDANFVQFDGFVPILKKISFSDVSTLTITTDDGDVTCQVSSNSETVKCFSGDRYLGKLVFGDGMINERDAHLGQDITYNIPFAPSTVVSVPSTSGVYSLDSVYGDVVLSFSSDFILDDTPSGLKINAIALPDSSNDKILKSMNGYTANRLYIGDSSVIRVRASSFGLNIGLMTDLDSVSSVQ